MKWVSGILAALFTVMVALAIFVLGAGVINAQPLPPDPLTTFRADCQTVEGDSLIIRWGYESNGVYNWIGQGLEFTTQPGDYPQLFEYVTPIENPQLEPIGLGRWVSYPDDPAYDLIAGGLVESVFIELTFDDLPDCNEPTPEPTPNGSEPTPRPCPAWSIDSATGGLICLWELPDPPELTPEPD